MRTGSERVLSRGIGAIHRTQRVTDADIRGGRVRIPGGPLKGLFPTSREEIVVDLRGEQFSCRWDPKYGPDRERSGVISVGRDRAERLFTPENFLRVTVEGGIVRLS